MKEIEQHNIIRLKAISGFLKWYRINNGLSQQQLSEQSNLSRNSIVRAENARNITLLSLFELADALEIDVNQIFQDIK